MMIQRDYAGLSVHLRSDPSLAILGLLKQSDVPLMVSYAYDDANHFINTNADTMPLLKAGVPRRYLQGTGGHGSAGNQTEGALLRDFLGRIRGRILRGIPPGLFFPGLSKAE